MFNCYNFPGATLGHLAYHLRLLLTHSVAPTYDAIVVVGGICDISVVERDAKNRSRVVKPGYTAVQSLIENFERLFSLFRTTTELFTNIPIMLVTVPGIHLNPYSSLETQELYDLQPIIDISIPFINVIIKKFNGLNAVQTPDIAKFIHHSKGRGGRYRTCYCKLYDGCHPTKDTRCEWASEILKATTNLLA